MSYDDESAEQQRRNSARPNENRPKKRRKFGLFWWRVYTPTVVVWEVFFRTRMGGALFWDSFVLRRFDGSSHHSDARFSKYARL